MAHKILRSLRVKFFRKFVHVICDIFQIILIQIKHKKYLTKNNLQFFDKNHLENDYLVGVASICRYNVILLKFTLKNCNFEDSAGSRSELPEFVMFA